MSTSFKHRKEIVPTPIPDLTRVVHTWWPRFQRPGEGPRHVFGYAVMGRRSRTQRQHIAHQIRFIRWNLKTILRMVE